MIDFRRKFRASMPWLIRLIGNRFTYAKLEFRLRPRLSRKSISYSGRSRTIQCRRFGAAISVPPFRCRRFGAREMDKMGHFGAKFFLFVNAILSKLILP